MNNYERLENLAKELLDIDIKYNNDMFNFLLGAPLYEINTKNSYGDSEYAVLPRMNAIYDRYNRDVNTKKIFEDSLIKIINRCVNGKFLFPILLIIEYQLKAQKLNTSPFFVDFVPIFELLKSNLKKNYAFNSKKGYIPDFEKHNSILESNYGMKIL